MPSSLLTVTPLTASGISHVFYNFPSQGLVLWLDASQISGIASGTSLSAWTDLSGSGKHAVQASAGSQPVLVTPGQNGAGIVSWSTGGKAILTSQTSIQQNWTYALTVQSRATTGNHDYLGGGSVIALFDDGGNYQTAVATALVGSAFTSGAWVSAIAQVSGSSTTLSISGKTFFGDAGTSTNNTLNIGALGVASSWLNGAMGEVVVYNRILTETERSSLETYLRSKWSTL